MAKAKQTKTTTKITFGSGTVTCPKCGTKIKK